MSVRRRRKYEEGGTMRQSVLPLARSDVRRFTCSL
jgi:hypothetical protein